MNASDATEDAEDKKTSGSVIARKRKPKKEKPKEGEENQESVA